MTNEPDYKIRLIGPDTASVDWEDGKQQLIALNEGDRDLIEAGADPVAEGWEDGNQQTVCWANAEFYAAVVAKRVCEEVINRCDIGGMTLSINGQEDTFRAFVRAVVDCINENVDHPYDLASDRYDIKYLADEVISVIKAEREQLTNGTVLEVI